MPGEAGGDPRGAGRRQRQLRRLLRRGRPRRQSLQHAPAVHDERPFPSLLPPLLLELRRRRQLAAAGADRVTAGVLRLGDPQAGRRHLDRRRHRLAGRHGLHLDRRRRRRGLLRRLGGRRSHLLGESSSHRQLVADGPRPRPVDRSVPDQQRRPRRPGRGRRSGELRRRERRLVERLGADDAGVGVRGRRL